MKLALGTVQFGLDYGINNKNGIVSLDEINRILDFAQKNNVTIIDTAQAYGKSEEQLGQSGFKNFNYVTKLKPSFSNEMIDFLVDESFNKLHIIQLYGILYHSYNDYSSNPESIKSLYKIREKGKVAKIGFSLYHPEELENLLYNKIDFDLIQIPFNIFDQRFSKYFKVLKERNVEIHCRSVFLQGLVFMNPNNMNQHFSCYVDFFKKFHSEINKLGGTVAEICLKYVLSFEEIDQVIIGVNSLNELINNINLLKVKPYDKELRNIFNNYQISDDQIILPYNWK